MNISTALISFSATIMALWALVLLADIRAWPTPPPTQGHGIHCSISETDCSLGERLNHVDAG